MKNPKFKEKGQLFSGDIAIATVVFLAALALAFFLWNSATDDINRAEQLRNLQKVASETIEQLIRTPGIPEDWNYYTVQVPGLATKDREINSTKVLAFIDLMNSTNSTHYGENKYLMGLGEYDFYMDVTELDGDTLTINGIPFIAGKLLSGATDSISMPRTAIFNGDIVRINFVIWK